MVPVVPVTRNPIAAHHPLGVSTGFLTDLRNDWEGLAGAAAAASPFAVEFAALSERELPGLLQFLRGAEPLPFHYVSVHAPSKDLLLDEQARLAMLADLPAFVDAIVIHPDVVENVTAYEHLGDRVVIENMDARKERGRTAAELRPFFEALPSAGLCFDVAHAHAVDPTMAVAGELLDCFADRLRHVHFSSLDASGGHVPLSSRDEVLYQPLLARCQDLPWIAEAPFTHT